MFFTAKHKFNEGDFVKLDITDGSRYGFDVTSENGNTGRIEQARRNSFTGEPAYLVDITGGWYYIREVDLQPSTKEQHKYEKLILS